MILQTAIQLAPSAPLGSALISDYHGFDGSCILLQSSLLEIWVVCMADSSLATLSYLPLVLSHSQAAVHAVPLMTHRDSLQGESTKACKLPQTM